MQPDAQLAAFIKQAARRLGFELVGITTPEPPEHLQVYRAWIERGGHAEMGYLAGEQALQRRADPRTLLPECQSILVVGANYLPPDQAADREGPVAAYALGRDYHRVLSDRLRQLVSELQTKLGRALPQRIYTDTGPILERELAQRAGLGWIGKNTCLIHPRQGSYFLLAELLLGLPLPADPPITADHCGSCTRCIQACPTQCIEEDRTIDASRCISYLTIELKGQIPRELRSRMGGWIFGCDVCQQVCPWNLRFAQPTQDPAFQTRPPLQGAEASWFLELDREGYLRQLKDSPLKRAKLRGLMRNAAVAGGNRKDASLVPALRHSLRHDPEPLVRGHAAWALGAIGGRAARQALHSARLNEIDPQVQRELQAAIGQSAAGA